jgi:hypothetical protein
MEVIQDLGPPDATVVVQVGLSDVNWLGGRNVVT